MPRPVPALGCGDWPLLEALASAVRDDLNNEVVPRWLGVAVSSTNTAAHAWRHRVAVEDRQPGWDNPSLLDRLPLF